MFVIRQCKSVEIIQRALVKNVTVVRVLDQVRSPQYYLDEAHDRQEVQSSTLKSSLLLLLLDVPALGIRRPRSARRCRH